MKPRTVSPRYNFYPRRCCRHTIGTFPLTIKISHSSRPNPYDRRHTEHSNCTPLRKTRWSRSNTALAGLGNSLLGRDLAVCRIDQALFVSLFVFLLVLDLPPSLQVALFALAICHLTSPHFTHRPRLCVLCRAPGFDSVYFHHFEHRCPRHRHCATSTSTGPA